MLVVKNDSYRSCDIHLSDGVMCKTTIFQLCNRMQYLNVYIIYIIPMRLPAVSETSVPGCHMISTLIQLESSNSLHLEHQGCIYAFNIY